ncbi:DUF1761 domain-containing protein [Nioella sp.]|jgi:hypothetical protein|uniref:DUF1761 domain-containing protein n=1 Tax=Nioella sp. TaxID=1912091 RepID=UPI003512F957
MEFLNVLVAGAAAWIFGALWYMVLAQPWMEANGLSEDQIDRGDPKPYIVSFLMAILVAGMTRHILASAGITTVGGGLMVGAGLGLFVAAPWVVNNVMYSLRGKSLIWIDGGYPVIGCTIIGVVLMLF